MTGSRVVAAIVVATLLIGAWACLGPEERIAFLFYDDAYYYLGVARHLANGEGSTFDGINATNGYHPLWCAILVPLFGIVDDPGLAVRIVGLLWYGLAAAAAVLLWWALRERSGSLPAAVAAGIFALHPAIMLRLGRPNGLETALYAALLALFLGAWERIAPTPRRLFLLGLLLGAVILARLDAGMFALAAAALLAPRFRSIVSLATGASVVVLPVLLWNAIRFGSPMPISERAMQVYIAGDRASRLAVGLEELPLALAREAFGGWSALDPVWRFGWPLGLLVILVVVGAALVAIRMRVGGLDGRSDALVLLASGCALHYLAYTLWFWAGGEREFRLYYFMPEGMLVAATVGTLAGRLRERLVVAGLAAYAAAGIGVSCARIGDAPSEPGPLAERRLYGWVRHNLPAEAVVATTDAGLLGFFCGRPAVNLDGLINDVRFLEALRTGRRDRYVADSPITHLVAGVGALHGWSPDTPDRPPERHDWMGTLLYEVHRLPGVSLREAGRVEDWVVFEIIREPR